ncbi:MAG: hypothetical protein LIP11_10135 [Clostridiales bacterium]|nr:hypothetical protein [Clostridiales bacterium]
MKKTLYMSIAVILLAILIIGTGTDAYAKETAISVTGCVYEFDEDGHYVLDEAVSSAETSSDNTVGQLVISRDITTGESSDTVPAYTINDGVITLSYTFDQSALNTDENDWCITDDKTKRVNDLQLDSNILSGALILQTSLDGETWITENISGSTDIFSEDFSLQEPFYTAVDIQLQNGCYYRVYIVYEMQRKLENTKILFVDRENYEYKKIAEVYEFYAAYPETGASASDTPRKTLGSKVNTGKDNGYSGNNSITSSDPHYGWNIGEFFINGYTRETSDDSGNTYFLKNVGDKVTLWFTLEQDIDCLNGDSNLSIADDANGYDQYFETDKTDFGRGTLIIQYTDEEGVKHDPIVYTNYLAACARTGADTKVQLFEEGDYEVSLDYEIAKKSGPLSAITSYTDYKISFTFSIRNGNCMVYPFDIVTGSELSDHGITENGFTLDMAKSKYLTIDVTRSILTMGADGQLVEDVRFNRPAKDGDQYTDEGIYTFKVNNLYTNESTTKTIYVGTDRYLTALSTTGYTLEELNAQLAQGATVSESGIIIGVSEELESETAVVEEADEPETESSADDAAITEQSEEMSEEESADTASADTEQKTTMPVYAGVAALILVLIIVLIFIVRKRHNGQENQ